MAPDAMKEQASQYHLPLTLYLERQLNQLLFAQWMDAQTDIQLDGQTDGQTNGQTDIQMYGWGDRQMD